MSTLEHAPESSFLFYTGNGSDKVYQAHLRQKEAGWVVDYGNGPRGGTLRTGTKTATPIAYEAARKIYDKLVREKTSGGYTPDQSGTLYTASDLAGRKSGELPQLPTAITEEEAERLLSDSAWGLQRKEDGENRILICEGTTIRGTNRRGLFVDIPQHWVGPTSNGRTIIPGEHVGDRFKAFDLLEFMGQDYRPMPYLERFNQLEKITRDIPWLDVIPLDLTTEAKRRRAEWIRFADGEGLVYKRLDAPFETGRSENSLKSKFTETATCLVLRQNAQRSVAVGLRDDTGAMIDLGNVTIPPSEALPAVGSLVEVRYLYRFDGGKFEQPVFKMPRPDMIEEAAVLSQVTRIKVRGDSESSEHAAEEEAEESAEGNRPRG
ncbi:ATP-dependent DNA ligase [Variovorax ginsengisoli]|uniref:ATP-dependent DNA ligase n=1 Tax=Variovorax ginsengisoli TaxID=363844 RepID=A0ABT8SE05_9BURK|nr:ATP-dependent DNA ligase [Variovorax ginsengisoli]MDN8616516.1 ATP-dependent DNA ligase [Variovorax ginsengisoli]MDO1535686.1 ATP-dependent DNA ligase [Variovorax ginsengisoli]